MVKQPKIDPIKHRRLCEHDDLRVVMEMPDQEVFEKLSTPNDPVSL